MQYNPPRKHAHGHVCFFEGCPYVACKRAQLDAKRYGFTESGEIAAPKPKKFPWEDAA